MDYLNFIPFLVFYHDHDSLESVFKPALDTNREKSMKLGVCFVQAPSIGCAMAPLQGPVPETALQSLGFQVNSQSSPVFKC